MTPTHRHAMNPAPVHVPDHIRERAARVPTALGRHTVEQALTLYDAGWCRGDIAARLAVAPATIDGWRYRAGLPANGARPTQIPSAEIERTIRLYVDEGMTLDQVAAELGLSPMGVKGRLVRAGVPLRPTGPAHVVVDAIPDGWVSMTELARRTGMSRAHLTRHAQRGRLPGARSFVWRQRPVWAIPEDRVPEVRASYRPGVRRRRPALQIAAVPAVASPTPRDRDWLPVAPFIEWIRRTGLTTGELAGGDEATERKLRRILSGEQLLVNLSDADRLLLAHDSLLTDVWADVDAALAEGDAAWQASRKASYVAMQAAMSAAPQALAA